MATGARLSAPDIPLDVADLTFMFTYFYFFFSFPVSIAVWTLFHSVFFLWILCCLLGFGFCCDSFSI